MIMLPIASPISELRTARVVHAICINLVTRLSLLEYNTRSVALAPPLGEAGTAVAESGKDWASLQVRGAATRIAASSHFRI
jgi:hypothetical protein